jgi:hypothetical protein
LASSTDFHQTEHSDIDLLLAEEEFYQLGEHEHCHQDSRTTTAFLAI